MGKVMTGMTVSLDGFVNDRSGSAQKLNPDFSQLEESPAFKEMIANTGAAVMGRHVYDMADPFMWANDDYEFQTPIFVLTHNPPEKFPKGNGKLSFTFVTDGIESAISQAKNAAGGKDVQVIGGADTIQQLLNAGLCDELQLDYMSVLLGDGLSMFDNIDTGKFTLQRIKAVETTPFRTSISFKVTNS